MRDELIKTVKVLEAGGTILYPTDTIWGIGCDATNAKAVQKVYKLKKRNQDKSFIVLLDQPEKLLTYVEDVPDIVWDLLNNVDTPLTVVYPNAKNLAKNVVAPDHSIAIRIVNDQFCKRLINLFNKPIVSSSANFAGEASPLMFHDIPQELISGVDYAVNVNRDKINNLKASTMIKLNKEGDYTVIRS